KPVDSGNKPKQSEPDSPGNNPTRPEKSRGGTNPPTGDNLLSGQSNNAQSKANTLRSTVPVNTVSRVELVTVTNHCPEPVTLEIQPQGFPAKMVEGSSMQIGAGGLAQTSLAVNTSGFPLGEYSGLVRVVIRSGKDCKESQSVFPVTFTVK